MVERHEKNGALMTIVLARVEEVEEYGIADLDEGMKIKRFVEKPSKEKCCNVQEIEHGKQYVL